MRRLSALVIAAVLWCGFAGVATAQRVTSDSTQERLRVFIDCQQMFSCDLDYFRTELTWVDHVRTP